MRRLLACLAGLTTLSAGAADIGVLPVGLSLTARQDRQAITVTNQGNEPVVMQVEPVAWSQTGGEDQYTATQDLLVNPPLFNMAPGKSQIVRVGLRHAPPGGREVAYRLFLREVRSASASAAPVAAGEDADARQIRVLLELRLPVYVAPANVLPAQQWRARRTPDGNITVEVVNTGNVHLVVAELKLRAVEASTDTPPLAALKASNTVLPGQSHHWELGPEPAASGHHITLEVVTDHGSQHVALDLGSD
jgi:fimbrial chaperone protein